MKETIDIAVVLEELYAAEPELRNQDASLRRLAEELLASRPEAPVDERFVVRLREEIRARAPRRAGNPFINFFTMPTNKYLVPGLAALALVAVGVASLSSLKPTSVYVPQTVDVAHAPTFTRVAANSFGALAGDGSGAGAESAGGGMGISAASPGPNASFGRTAASDSSISPAVDMKMMPPDWTPTVYRHTYKGEAIEGLQAQVDVYRRERVSGAAAPISALLGHDLGLLDLAKAKNGSVQSFSIAEDRENGYIITVSPEEGSVSIYENYQTWTYPERNCADEACFAAARLKESDMIADADAIRIADAFLAEYGVAREGYGQPVVRDSWKVMRDRVADASMFWYPENVTVVYPELIDGKPVHDESGQPTGMTVSVNVRHKRASSLSNLMLRSFQVSGYAGETDAAALVAVAEKGGVNGGWGEPEGAKVVDVELGTPTLAHVRTWQWKDGKGLELTVPSLVFPVLNAPQDYGRTSVTVPLAKELLQSVEPVIGLPVLPMPTEPVILF